MYCKIVFSVGWSKLRMSEEIALPLNISQAALRQESDFSIEQSSEAELIVNKLEESEYVVLFLFYFSKTHKGQKMDRTLN